DVAALQQTVQHIANPPWHAGCDVENDARRKRHRRAYCECGGAHDITHVQKITLHIQIADAHDWRNEARFDFCDLHGKVGNNKALGLPRPAVIEWAKAYALQPAMSEGTQ